MTQSLQLIVFRSGITWTNSETTFVSEAFCQIR